MAQLKDLIVTGASRLVGDVYTSQIQISKIKAPTTAGGTTYGAGSSGQVLMSDGSTTHWGNVSSTDEKVKYDKSTSNTAFKVLAGANGSPTNGTSTSTAVYCDNITLSLNSHNEENLDCELL